MFLENAFDAHLVLNDDYVPLGKGCTTAYYIDEDCDAMRYRAAEIGLSKRIYDSGIYDENIKPSVSVSGCSPWIYSSPLNIPVNAQDDSGIDRVEFYLSIDGKEFRLIGINRTLPYSYLLNLSEYNEAEFYFRVYIFDNAWNMFGHPDSGSQIGPLYKNSSQQYQCIHNADKQPCDGKIDT